MRFRSTAATMGLCALIACSTLTPAAAFAEEPAKPKAPAAAAAGSPVTIDLSTPKKAALTFARGIEQGDQKAVKAATTGSAEDYALIDLIGGIVTANKELQAAAIAKFGEAEGKQLAQPQEPLETKVEASKETITGDTATLTNPDDNKPTTLKKVGNDWKIDLSKIPDRDQVAQAKPIVAAMTKMMKEMAGEIKDGKYKTAEEAKQGLGMKMLGAISAAGAGAPGGAAPGGEGGAGAPPTPPADAPKK